MQLGISSLGHIIEYGMTKKDAYHTLIDLLLNATEACLTYSEDNHFKVCELIIDPPDIFSNENRSKFIELCNTFSIKKQIHGPFIDMGLCSHNDKISKASIKSYIETAQIMPEINASIITIHPGVANFLINSIKGFNFAQLKRAVNELLDTIVDLNVQVCMENMPLNTKILLNEVEMEQFFSAMNREDLYFTYDTSHAWTCDTNIHTLWERLHPIIKNIHLVDNFEKSSDTHPALGTGKINFQEIFNLIKKYKYDGSLIIELSQASDSEKSIAHIKQYL
ncbi:MAG: sugar phosphate isomerase/epimerase [Promethearchaeota archaeon]|nr:MAG: sugar phosphate isomerase/epimerase [Candidatus Lokiarchaeota archaeon]